MAGLIKRGNVYYVQWYVGKTEKRRSLCTGSVKSPGKKYGSMNRLRLGVIRTTVHGAVLLPDHIGLIVVLLKSYSKRAFEKGLSA